MESTTNCGRVEPIGSPNIVLVGFEHKSIQLRILVDLISSADFEEPITERVWIIQADPALGDCKHERDGANWSSRMSFSRVKQGLGLFPRARSAASNYDERVNSVK